MCHTIPCSSSLGWPPVMMVVRGAVLMVIRIDGPQQVISLSGRMET
jgi:hypothetical protein